MEYNLAKKLKDAGFPEIVIQDNPAGTAPLSIETGPYRPSISMLPSLSTLIEACGKEFGAMEVYRTADKEYWEAGYGIDRDGEIIKPSGEGSTPEEAVYNLWLALNKKV